MRRAVLLPVAPRTITDIGNPSAVSRLVMGVKGVVWNLKLLAKDTSTLTVVHLGKNKTHQGEKTEIRTQSKLRSKRKRTF